jgi:hypothetical protein
MTPPERQHPGSAARIVIRVIAGIATAAAGLVFLVAAWLAVSSRFGLGGRDIHGYGLIVGTVLAVIAGFVTALVLPVLFPPRIRGRAHAIGLASFGIVLVLLIAALVTA